MTEVVGYVQYDAEDLVECIRRRSEQTSARKADHASGISATAANLRAESQSLHLFVCLTGVRCRVPVQSYIPLT